MSPVAPQPAGAGDRFDAPAVASRRRALLNGLPSLYRDDRFTESFVGAFEQVLDPILAVLDGIDAHFDVRVAPDDVLDVLATWLGFDLDDDWREQPRRHFVEHVPDLARRHGTRAGLELALHLAFPALPLRIEDGGRVAVGRREEDLPPGGSGELLVACEVPVPDADQRALARAIEAAKPAHVPYKLRVRRGEADAAP